LPMAPTNRSRQMSVTRCGVRAASAAICSGCPRTSAKSSEPNVAQMKKMPVRKPKSPIRLTTNAFLAAAAALGLANQKPISR